MARLTRLEIQCALLPVAHQGPPFCTIANIGIYSRSCIYKCLDNPPQTVGNQSAALRPFIEVALLKGSPCGPGSLRVRILPQDYSAHTFRTLSGLIPSNAGKMCAPCGDSGIRNSLRPGTIISPRWASPSNVRCSKSSSTPSTAARHEAGRSSRHPASRLRSTLRSFTFDRFDSRGLLSRRPDVLNLFQCAAREHRTIGRRIIRFPLRVRPLVPPLDQQPAALFARLPAWRPM